MKLNLLYLNILNPGTTEKEHGSINYMIPEQFENYLKNAS